MNTKKEKFYAALFLCLKWLGILLLAHVVIRCFYAILLQDMAVQLANDYPNEPGKPVLPLLLFDLAFTILFFLLYNNLLQPIAPSQKSAIQKQVGASEFSALRYWKAEYLKSSLGAVAMFALLQLPFLFFFASYGFSFTAPILLDYFYVWEAGFYLKSGSALLGWLICTAFFALCCFATRLLLILLAARRE